MPEERAAGPKILIAEDNEDHAMFIKRALRDTGLEVVHAVDGEAALEYLTNPENPVPAMALLDINMPRLSGLDLLKKVRADERLKWMAVVMFSTSNERTDVRAAYELGANSYVPKPMDFSEFQARLREVGAYWTRINHAAR